MARQRVLRRARARQDLVEQAQFIGADSGEDVAMRFLDSCEETFRKLAERPGTGSPYRLANPLLEGIRMRPVVGFPKHLVFYLELPDGIRVVRVLHARRDLPNLLENEGAD